MLKLRGRDSSRVFAIQPDFRFRSPTVERPFTVSLAPRRKRPPAGTVVAWKRIACSTNAWRRVSSPISTTSLARWSTPSGSRTRGGGHRRSSPASGRSNLISKVAIPSCAAVWAITTTSTPPTKTISCATTAISFRLADGPRTSSSRTSISFTDGDSGATTVRGGDEMLSGIDLALSAPRSSLLLRIRRMPQGARVAACAQ